MRKLRSVFIHSSSRHVWGSCARITHELIGTLLWSTPFQLEPVLHPGGRKAYHSLDITVAISPYQFYPKKKKTIIFRCLLGHPLTLGNSQCFDYRKGTSESVAQQLSRQETPNSVVGGIGKRTQYHESTHTRAHRRAHVWEHIGASIWEHIGEHTYENTHMRAHI